MDAQSNFAAWMRVCGEEMVDNNNGLYISVLYSLLYSHLPHSKWEYSKEWSFDREAEVDSAAVNKQQGNSLSQVTIGDSAQ